MKRVLTIKVVFFVFKHDYYMFFSLYICKFHLELRFLTLML